MSPPPKKETTCCSLQSLLSILLVLFFACGNRGEAMVSSYPLTKHDARTYPLAFALKWTVCPKKSFARNDSFSCSVFVSSLGFYFFFWEELVDNMSLPPPPPSSKSNPLSFSFFAPCLLSQSPKAVAPTKSQKNGRREKTSNKMEGWRTAKNETDSLEIALIF